MPEPDGAPVNSARLVRPPAGLVLGEPDLAAAETAAAAFLAALGWNLNSEHTAGTPARMARAYAEILTPEPFAMTSFDSGGHAGLVTVEGIGFTSVCAHHALPFTGSAEISYVPGDRVAGLSKIARTVQAAASGPQVQERMADQIADRLMDAIAPRGVAVRLRARHLCLTARGARADGASMTTSVARGLLAGTHRHCPGSAPYPAGALPASVFPQEP